jgi:uncharacterized repeat protein (TIGR01451 family)
MICTIIEGGRLFQGWLTVQNATRAAGRYAITGQFDKDCLNEFPPCLDPRVDSIEAEARRTVAGVPVDPTVVVGQPSSLAVEVWGQDEDGVWHPDYAGESGQNVRIRVTYYMPIVTPLLQPIVEVVPLVGQIVAVNEDFNQFSTSQIDYDPPTTGDVGGPLVVPEANLVITKTVASPDVEPGSPPSIFTTHNVKFDVEVRNLGPFDAEGVTLTDLLPDNFKYVSYTTTRGAQCDDPQDPPQVTPQINCLLPDLAGDAGSADEKVVYLSFTAQTPLAPVFETITNTVSVSMDPTAVDPFISNNSAGAGLELIPHVNLIVSKEDSVDPAIVGEPFMYQIDVYNPGPNTAEDVVITDRMPQNFTYQGHGLSTGSCTVPVPPDRDLVCQMGDLAAFDTAFVWVSGIPEVEGSIENNAWATSPTHEDNPSNNSASESTQVTVVSELEISKSGPSQVDYGEEINYVLDVTNNGPSPIDNITVIDRLPRIDGNLAVSYRSSSSGCSPTSASRVQCTIPALAANASTQLTITVEAILPGYAVNRATVSSSALDPDTSNNSNNAATYIRAIADLGVEKSVAGPAIVGEALDFTVDVTNYGPSPAPGITLRDKLDPNIVLDDDTMSVSGCDNWYLSGDEIVCRIDYLNNGATATVNLTVLVDSNINVGVASELGNDATVTLTGIDPQPDNNSDSVSTNIVFPARLSISKSGPATSEVGSTYVYQLQVTNQGPVKATNVVVEDVLPPLVSFISASPSGNCSEQNGRVTCSFPELAAGAPPLDILIQVSADQVGIADNTATVTADQVDPDMSDNASTWQTDIFLPSADLTLELDPESAVLFVPRSWPFNLRFFIANLGPSTAENTVLTITTDIPSNKVYVDPPCNEVSNNGYATFVCNLGDLIVGGPQSLDVELSISQRGLFTFNASINTTTFDPDPSNNVFGPGTIDVY